VKSKLDIRKYFFSQRVTNQLTASRVGTVDGFKIWYDEFMKEGRLGTR
jgi:hypothetical protein